MFATVSAITPLGDHRYGATFDPSWFQGPGVYGGLTGAVLIRALEASCGAGRPARTLSVQFATTVAAGPATIEVQPERAGSSMAFASARLVQDGVRVHAMAAFGAPRSLDLDASLEPMPAVPPPEAVPSTPRGSPATPSPFPAFLDQFDTRFVAGVPYSGAARAGVQVWVGSRWDEPIDLALATAILDVPPPAILPRATTVRPMATATWTVHYLTPLPLATRGPLLLDVVSHTTHQGYSDQETRMFQADGTLVAIGRQLVTVIR